MTDYKKEIQVNQVMVRAHIARLNLDAVQRARLDAFLLHYPLYGACSGLPWQLSDFPWLNEYHAEWIESLFQKVLAAMSVPSGIVAVDQLMLIGMFNNWQNHYFAKMIVGICLVTGFYIDDPFKAWEMAMDHWIMPNDFPPSAAVAIAN